MYLRVVLLYYGCLLSNKLGNMKRKRDNDLSIVTTGKQASPNFMKVIVYQNKVAFESRKFIFCKSMEGM